MNYWLLLVPLLSTLMGWLIIKIFVWLLFRPLTPRKILGITFHGILLSQKQPIAVKVGQLAGSMLNPADLEQKISDPRHIEKIKPMIETHVDHFLRVRLKEQMPMISMFVGDKTIHTLKTVFMQEIENLFPQVMRQFAGNLVDELEVEQMVVSKINDISPAALESAFYQNMGKEIGRAAFLGALLGLLTGIAQLLLIIIIG